MPLPVEIRNNFTSLITGRSGLYFKDHDLKNLEDSIALRMKALGLEAPMSYYSYLALSDKHEDEFRELMNILTVNHTYFFRDTGQFDALRERVLTELIKRKGPVASSQGPGGKQLAIWSAGCSTGEEPYTIAIILKELLGESIKDWDIHILATDASSSALEAARKGVYRKNAVRNVPEDLLEKYFHEVHNTSGRNPERSYRIDRSIKNMVNFDYFNLMDEKYPSFFDVIFCRNVVIYFELETTASVMNKFYESMSNDGYLFIGYSETLQYMSDKFRMQVFGDGIYYKKIFPPLRERPMIRFDMIGGEDQETEQIQVEAPAEEPAIFFPVIEEAKEEETITAPVKAESLKDLSDLLTQASRFIAIKKYDDALRILKEAHRADPKAVLPYYLEVETMIDKGDLKGAKSELKELRLIDPLSAQPYYFSGIINMEEDRIEEAKSDLKKAIYLNKDFPLANFYLGQVHKKEGRLDEAIREYRNAAKLLSKRKSDAIIPLSGGFNSAVLISVCKDNIERLKMEIV